MIYHFLELKGEFYGEICSLREALEEKAAGAQRHEARDLGQLQSRNPQARKPESV